MAETGLFTATDDHLENYDGDTVAYAVMTADFVPTASLADIADALGEVTAGDAPGYARPEVEVAWDEADRRLVPQSSPNVDLAGAPDISYIVVVELDGTPISWFRFPPIAGVDGQPIDLPYIAGYMDQAAVDARLDALEARPILPLPAAPVDPDPSTDAGMTPVVQDDGTYLLVPAGSGSGGATSTQLVNLTGETAGPIALNLLSGPHAVPASIDAVAILAPAGSSTITITPPDGRLRGHLGVALGAASGDQTLVVAGLDASGVVDAFGVIEDTFGPAPTVVVDLVPLTGGLMAPVGQGSGGGGGGVSVHGALTGRDADDQHPTGAITVPADTFDDQPADVSLTDVLLGIRETFDAAASEIAGKADKTTTVNGHALSANVTVTAADVGAPPSSRSVSTGSGLTGGGDLTADRTLALAAIADQRILGNVSGGSAAPVALTAAQLRTLLALVVGTDVQAYDSDLAAIAALATTTYGRALLTLANQAALQAAVGLAYPQRASIQPLIDSPILGGSTTAVGTLANTTYGGGYTTYGPTTVAGIDVSWPVLLDAGTYSGRVIVRQLTNGAIATVKLDGTTVTTVDGYAASAASNVIGTFAGLTVTAGQHTLNITNPTKNASSSAYALAIQAVELYRTGP